ncbi:MAG: DUF86 domain-containing protein [bacterium]|nr:DUF86 domain-containing protein [bacterium]
MLKNDEMYIGHILDAIEKIDKYIEGIDREAFITSNLHVDGVARELSIIGEAASRLSQEFCKAHPEIPFRNIIGMRNIIIHEYAGMDAYFLWDTSKHDLPALKVALLPSRPKEA